MVLDIISLVGIAFSGVGLFLSIFFLLRNCSVNDGYRFLYLTLIILAYEVFYKTLIHSHLIYDFLMLYPGHRFFNLLIYPVFFLFIKSISNKSNSLSKPHLLLLLFFIGSSVYSFSLGLMIPQEEKRQLLDLFYKDTRPGPYNYWGNWKTLLKSMVIPVLFLMVIAYDFYKFTRQSADLQRKRLFIVLASIIILYFLFNQFSNQIYSVAYTSTGFSMIEWPVDIVFLSLLLCLLAILTLSVNSGDTFFPPSKYKDSRLDKKAYLEIIALAQKTVGKEELYKNHQLSIATLAKAINTNPKYLSQSLNDHLGISFVDFINQYRVEEAKSLLTGKDHKALTIAAIGQLAGFQSKSSFFRAFKKFTGLTPNQYILSQKSSAK